MQVTCEENSEPSGGVRPHPSPAGRSPVNTLTPGGGGSLRLS